jgi:hypothetical protein
MDVEAKVTDANSNNDKRGYNAAVNGDTAPMSSIPQCGDGPKNVRFDAATPKSSTFYVHYRNQDDLF